MNIGLKIALVIIRIYFAIMTKLVIKYEKTKQAEARQKVADKLEQYRVKSPRPKSKSKNTVENYFKDINIVNGKKYYSDHVQKNFTPYEDDEAMNMYDLFTMLEEKKLENRPMSPTAIREAINKINVIDDYYAYKILEYLPSKQLCDTYVRRLMGIGILSNAYFLKTCKTRVSEECYNELKLYMEEVERKDEDIAKEIERQERQAEWLDSMRKATIAMGALNTLMDDSDKKEKDTYAEKVDYYRRVYNLDSSERHLVIKGYADVWDFEDPAEGYNALYTEE